MYKALQLEEINGIKTGRLSGIVAHYVPSYLRRNNMPSWETNSIDNWEEKILKICDETSKEEMTVLVEFHLGFKCILKNFFFKQQAKY